MTEQENKAIISEKGSKILNYLIDEEIFGRFNTVKLCRQISEQSDTEVDPGEISFYVGEINDSPEDIRLNHSNGKVFVRNMTFDRYKKYKEQIPEEGYDLFEETVSTGFNPNTVIALLNYWQHDLTRKKAATKFNVSTHTLRVSEDKMFDRFPELTEEFLQVVKSE